MYVENYLELLDSILLHCYSYQTNNLAIQQLLSNKPLIQKTEIATIGDD